ncbi:MAG: lipoyl(octanoyl) transferase LipB [Planctomycetes bacterium]|nr:lipoyl(octanoyl) transferase LipB [Planctomycetota bacterium]
MNTQWLGRRRYAEVWETQRAMLKERVRALEAGEPGVDHLLLVEHEPVYTWGKRTKPEHLGEGAAALARLGADTFEVERGGEVTFHGPGQLVGYPIVYLGNLRCGRDLHKYMRGLEEVMIRVLATYGLQGERAKGMTGVWAASQESGVGSLESTAAATRHQTPDTRHAKVAALGVRVSKWCTMHGFALNVTNEVLPWFGHITPCGIKGRGVTSLEKLLGRAPEMSEVRGRVIEAFRKVLL